MMNRVFQELLSQCESWPDGAYGETIRCAATLKDGTNLQCVVLHCRDQFLKLAKKRIDEECDGGYILSGNDPYGQILGSLFLDATRVAEYQIKALRKSKYALPRSLLNQIEGETTMAWTGWVFEMNDGKMFSYGTTFNIEFFQLPEGYLFSDVKNVHNHSYVDDAGKLKPLKQGGLLPEEYNSVHVYRERVFFKCAVKNIKRDTRKLIQ